MFLLCVLFNGEWGYWRRYQTEEEAQAGLAYWQARSNWQFTLKEEYPVPENRHITAVGEQKMEFIFDRKEIYTHVVGRHDACWRNHPEDCLSVHESSHNPCGFTEFRNADCNYPDKLFCRNPCHKEKQTHGVL